ncbi:MAG: polysaccharide deacetylase family protein [Alphaproteobacteria bacterium]|nr:polysaccharide deacetylase family protein [Alphaproteobacteria bacterium]
MLALLLACQRAADVATPPAPAPAPVPVPTPVPVPVTPPPPDPVPQDRRWDCAGLDPADPAPLGGRVALTFDDGPHGVVTPQVLQVLRDENVPATFFMLGVQLEDPTIWPLVEEMVADPLFTIANHSWSHPSMTNLSAAAQADEIDDTLDLLETFAPVDLFRFPYGLSDCGLVDGIRARGMHVTGWHVDTVDWCYGADGVCTPDDYFRIPPEYASDMIGFTVEQLERFDGGIVLMHDIHQSTADALPGLITELKARGFTFTTVHDATTFPNLLADTPADLPFLGEACDPVDDRCWQIEYSSFCVPVGDGTNGVCTLPCEGTCPDRAGAATTFCMTTETDAGECVGRAHAINAWCDRLPGTERVPADRYVGTSSASPLTLDVCR